MILSKKTFVCYKMSKKIFFQPFLIKLIMEDLKKLEITVKQQKIG